MGKSKKGYPNKLNRGQMGAYKGIQNAEKWPGGLDIHAGNELGFRSKDWRVKRGADKPKTFGMKLRKA